MTKEEALQSFWSRFYLSQTNIKAYDENTVPDNAQMPYITYEVIVDDIRGQVMASVDLWDRGTSWATVTALKDVIGSYIGYGGAKANYDHGQMWIKKGQPFARRVPDDDGNIRHIALNIEIEYFTED